MAAWSSESGSTPSGPMTLMSSSWVTKGDGSLGRHVVNGEARVGETIDL
jgi:hypothetical protein